MNALRKLFHIFSLALCLAACQQVSSRTDTATDLKPFEYVDSSGQELPYRLLEPEIAPGKKYPLVIFYHGAGSRGNDNQKQINGSVQTFTYPANQQKYPCYVFAPQCPEGKRWVEVDWGAASHTMPDTPSTPLRLSMEVLEELLKKYPIDTDRLYVTGLSMGGFATWDVISRYPKKFAAAVPVCGGGDEKQAANIAKVDVWAFHGDADSVVKPARSRHMINAIKEAGGAPKYREYRHTGHDSWLQAYADVELLPWMFSQVKKR